jgi:hypothetical protein
VVAFFGRAARRPVDSHGHVLYAARLRGGQLARIFVSANLMFDCRQAFSGTPAHALLFQRGLVDMRDDFEPSTAAVAGRDTWTHEAYWILAAAGNDIA